MISNRSSTTHTFLDREFHEFVAKGSLSKQQTRDRVSTYLQEMQVTVLAMEVADGNLHQEPRAVVAVVTVVAMGKGAAGLAVAGCGAASRGRTFAPMDSHTTNRINPRE